MRCPPTSGTISCRSGPARGSGSASRRSRSSASPIRSSIPACSSRSMRSRSCRSRSLRRSSGCSASPMRRSTALVWAQLGVLAISVTTAWSGILTQEDVTTPLPAHRAHDGHGVAAAVGRPPADRHDGGDRALRDLDRDVRAPLLHLPAVHRGRELVVLGVHGLRARAVSRGADAHADGAPRDAGAPASGGGRARGAAEHARAAWRPGSRTS